MKKVFAVILGVIFIVLTASGCAANQTVHYVDDATYEVQFYPNNEEGQVVACGLTAIQVITNTPNVELGTGELAIFRASDDKEIARYDARMDGDSVYLNSGKNPPYAQLIVMLPEGVYFEMGESYYVTMDEKFFYVDDIHDFVGTVEKGEWTFTVGEYGYDGNITEMPVTYLAGDTIEIPVAIAGEAAQAVLLYGDVTVLSADLRALSESGTFTLETIQPGTSTISVMFLKEDGTHLETLGFTVTIK